MNPMELRRPGVPKEWLKWKDDRDVVEAIQGYLKDPRIPCFDEVERLPGALGWKVCGGSWHVQNSQYGVLIKGFEYQSLANKEFNVDLAMRCLEAAYLEVLTHLPENKLGSTGLNAIHFRDMALGVILGCMPETTKLSKLLLLAARKGVLDGAPKERAQKMRPWVGTTTVFAARLLADYFKDPLRPTMIAEVARQFEYLEPLLTHWRTADMALLTHLLLIACDIHSRAWGTANYYMHTPLEALLVMKLRQLEGLPNPELDHPMMNGGLGQLPPPQTFRFTEESLTYLDGFDMDALIGDIDAKLRAMPDKEFAEPPPPLKRKTENEYDEANSLFLSLWRKGKLVTLEYAHAVRAPHDNYGEAIWPDPRIAYNWLFFEDDLAEYCQAQQIPSFSRLVWLCLDERPWFPDVDFDVDLAKSRTIADVQAILKIQRAWLSKFAGLGVSDAQRLLNDLNDPQWIAQLSGLHPGETVATLKQRCGNDILQRIPTPDQIALACWPDAETGIKTAKALLNALETSPPDWFDLDLGKAELSDLLLRLKKLKPEDRFLLLHGAP